MQLWLASFKELFCPHLEFQSRQSLTHAMYFADLVQNDNQNRSMQSSFFYPISNTGSAGIRRSKNACGSCRRRKVRCFAKNGVPCQPVSNASSSFIRRNKNGTTFWRSAKACEVCRRRKVKCNVVENGGPCNNCVHDNAECIIPEPLQRK